MTEPNEDTQEECILCGKALAIVGLVVAGIFLYISVDVFTDGGLTKLLSRSTHE